MGRPTRRDVILAGGATVSASLSGCLAKRYLSTEVPPRGVSMEEFDLMRKDSSEVVLTFTLTNTSTAHWNGRCRIELPLVKIERGTDRRQSEPFRVDLAPDEQWRRELSFASESDQTSGSKPPQLKWLEIPSPQTVGQLSWHIHRRLDAIVRVVQRAGSTLIVAYRGTLQFGPDQPLQLAQIFGEYLTQSESESGLSGPSISAVTGQIVTNVGDIYLTYQIKKEWARGYVTGSLSELDLTRRISRTQSF